MKQQTDKGAPSPVPSSACCRELESSSRVSGSESRHRVLLFYTALDLLTTWESLHLSVRTSFRRSTSSGSASTTKPNTMPPTNNRRCCQVMPPPMSIAETITSSVAILFFKVVPLLFCLLPEQQGGRWCGPRCLSM